MEEIMTEIVETISKPSEEQGIESIQSFDTPTDNESASDIQDATEPAPDWTEEAGDDLLVARELHKAHPDADISGLLAQVIELRERQSTLERERQRAEFVRNLREQEDAIRADDPDFDLLSAISQSPALRALILSGEPLERALHYVDPERMRQKIEREIIERIRRRNARPQPMDAANARARPIDLDSMSEDELRRIDERVKRGERVTL